MARFVDRVLNELEWKPPDYVYHDPAAYKRWDVTASRVARPALATAQVFVVDNISKYYFEEPSMCKTWRLDEDFPNVAPPYPIMWFEHKAPRWVIEAEQEGTPTRDPEKLKDLEKMPRIKVDARGIMENSGVLILSEEHKEVGAFGKWSSLYLPFMQPYGLKEVMACFGAFYLDINPDGSIKNIRPAGYADSDNYEEYADPDSFGFHTVQIHCVPFMLSLVFMHCRNVTVQEQIPPPPLSKKWKKRYGKPLIHYKVLEIEPVRRMLATEGRMGQMGVDYALHVCRGHFKHFEDKGLFGKYRGMWWWHDQLRGKLSEGVIEKEYSLGRDPNRAEPARAARPRRERKPKDISEAGGAITKLFQ